jgi:hypothetical protein
LHNFPKFWASHPTKYIIIDGFALSPKLLGYASSITKLLQVLNWFVGFLQNNNTKKQHIAQCTQIDKLTKKLHQQQNQPLSP